LQFIFPPKGPIKLALLYPPVLLHYSPPFVDHFIIKKHLYKGEFRPTQPYVHFSDKVTKSLTNINKVINGNKSAVDSIWGIYKPLWDR